MGIFSRLKDSTKNTMLISSLLRGDAMGAVSAVVADDPKKALETGAGAVKNFGKAAVQLTAQNPAVAEVAGIIGGEKTKGNILKKRNVPLIGEVKPFSANPEDINKYGTQTAKESAVQAGNMYLEAGVPGAGRVLAKAGGAVKNAIPSLEKTAEALSNVSAKTFKKASTPEIAAKVKEIRNTGVEDVAEGLGEEIFSTVQKTIKKAQDTYQKSRDTILAEKGPRIIERAKELVPKISESLNKSRISFTEGKANLAGTQFEGDDVAKQFLERLNGITSRPIDTLQGGSEAVDDLLARREAISNIVSEIPITKKSLKRVLSNVVDSFDSYIDDVTEGASSKLRQEYAKTIKPARQVEQALVTYDRGSPSFSPDKANSFIKQAMSNEKFDKRQILSQLDEVAGTDFARTTEALGVDKALSRLDPPTQGRFFDVVKTYVIAKAPGISAFVSPKFWGEMALRKGLQAEKAAKIGVQRSDEFLRLFAKNLLTNPIRNAATTGATLAADSSFEDEFGAESITEKEDTSINEALSLTEDNLSDEEFMNLFGAESVE